MRHTAYLLLMSLLLTSAAIGQKSKSICKEKGFISLTAGPSFPLSDYNSSDFTKERAGLANTGYNMELQGGWYVDKHFGFIASALYTRHAVDNSFASATSTNVDHWQYFSFLGGVVGSAWLGHHLFLDGKVSTGVSRVNSPKITFDGQILMAEAWSTTVPFKADIDLRYQVANRIQLIVGANYLYQDPSFKSVNSGTTYEFRQRMNVIGVNAGIGYGF